MNTTFWLGLAMVASVLIRRAATSALSSVSVWLVLTMFGGFLFQGFASMVGGDDPVAVARAELFIARISPLTLFQEASTLLLDPTQRAVGLLTYAQVDRAIVSQLTLSQSLLVVWPQIVAMVALTSALFALAFVSFMRQEVRA